MGILTRLFNFVNGTTADAEQMDAELNQILSELNGNVDNANIKDNAGIEFSKLTGSPNGVTTAQINDLAVTTAKIADANVTTAKIADDAVDAAKLKDDAAVDANRAVTTNHVRDAAITAPKAKLATYSALLSTLLGISSHNHVTASRYVSTGLDKTTLTPLCAYLEYNGAIPTGSEQIEGINVTILTRTSGDNLVYLGFHFTEDTPATPGHDLTLYTVKLVYIQNA